MSNRSKGSKKRLRWSHRVEKNHLARNVWIKVSHNANSFQGPSKLTFGSTELYIQRYAKFN